ncbi:MAG: hypothetical protein QMD61_11685, partial [Methanobacterium sp.]|nr:hypothetical protein [Methanobacterium sp.]
MKISPIYPLLMLFALILLILSISTPYAPKIDNFTIDEQVILNKSSSLSWSKQTELKNVFIENNKVRNQLYSKYNTTNNLDYYQSYVDSGYTLNVFSK